MGGQPVTGEPTTAAGRALDRWIEQAIVTTDASRAHYRSLVVKAEAEARAAALADVTAAAPALRVRKPHSGGLTQLDSGFNQGVRAVLAAIKELENR